MLSNHITKNELPGCIYGALLIIFCIGVRKRKQSTWQNKSTYIDPAFPKHSSGVTDSLILAAAAVGVFAKKFHRRRFIGT